MNEEDEEDYAEENPASLAKTYITIQRNRQTTQPSPRTESSSPRWRALSTLHNIPLNILYFMYEYNSQLYPSAKLILYISDMFYLMFGIVAIFWISLFYFSNLVVSWLTGCKYSNFPSCLYMSRLSFLFFICIDFIVYSTNRTLKSEDSCLNSV